jgi:threonine synthase
LIPLRRSAADGIALMIKQEAGNPTGSFKDRGLSVAVTRAVALGAPGVELPSAGNAAISISAYAAAAGIPCRVALPVDTPSTVRRLCRAYGAEVLEGGATLVESGRRLQETAKGFWSLATLKEPYRVEGKKTMGLELAEQLDWQLPDWIVYPTGGGTGIVGMHKAFAELERLGLIGPERPRFVSVQIEGCAPIVRAWERGDSVAAAWESPETDVWGLRVPEAIGDFLILEALAETDGLGVRVEEEAIGPMVARTMREEGLIVGPEGGAALVAVESLLEQGRIVTGDRVVVFQTGHPGNYGLELSS